MDRRQFLVASALTPAVSLVASRLGYGAEDDGWIQLFNGKDLTGWTPKIRGHEYGVNYADTFRVEDGVIKTAYDKYEGPFRGRYGHLFYKEPFSNYLLRIEYRFVGDQAKGGPGWATRNSGVMIHGQDPKEMTKDQEFPVSIEVQFLGGDGKNPRQTGNLCTPGTNVVMDGKLHTPHCTNSSSDTFHGDQWVTAEIEVHGGKRSGTRSTAKQCWSIASRNSIRLMRTGRSSSMPAPRRLSLAARLRCSRRATLSSFVRSNSSRCRRMANSV